MARETPERRVERLRRAREYKRARRDANPDAVRAQDAATQRTWRAAHPDERREAHARYRARNRDRFRLYWRQRKARRRGAECVDPEAHRDYAVILLGDPCAYCCGVAETVDHIVALAGGGSDEWDNLTAACVSCNARKWRTPLLLAMLRTERA